MIEQGISILIDASLLLLTMLIVTVDQPNTTVSQESKSAKEPEGRKPPDWAGILQFWARSAVTGERIC